MKTKEIDVWVDLDAVEATNLDSFVVKQIKVTNQKHAYNTAKAKLIIEIPEKKIEITESDFDAAWGDSIKEPTEGGRYYKLREKLGFTK